MSNYNGTPLEAKQMSIYDFLEDNCWNDCEIKSQEVAPSETLPQVDEAQAVNYYVTDKDGNNVDIYPSSALDVNITVEVAEKTPTLADSKFEVNQIVTTVNPYEEGDEDFHHLKEVDGIEVRIVEVKFLPLDRGYYYEVETIGGLTPKLKYFYEHELK